MKLDKTKNIMKLSQLTPLNNVLNSHETNCPKILKQENLVMIKRDLIPGRHLGRLLNIKNLKTGEKQVMETTCTTKYPTCRDTNENLVEYDTNINNTKITITKTYSCESKYTLVEPNQKFKILLPVVHCFTASKTLFSSRFIFNDPMISPNVTHFWTNCDFPQHFKFTDPDVDAWIRDMEPTKFFQELKSNLTEEELIHYLNWFLRNDPSFLEKIFLTLKHSKLYDYPPIDAEFKL